MSFSRSSALMGETAMARLQKAHIAVIGVGGVGSWCAEALVRTGLMHLTLVDDDFVQASNINRQDPATAKTIGEPKVEAMKRRLHEINPTLEITARQIRYSAGAIDLQDFDFIVDAIDSVDSKADLILAATHAGIPIVSSMGAALRLDPTKVVVKKFDRVEGDGLARALRRRFRKLNRLPAVKFPCVCSIEPPQPFNFSAFRPSYMPVTCAFGMALAAEVFRAMSEDMI